VEEQSKVHVLSVVDLKSGHNSDRDGRAFLINDPINRRTNNQNPEPGAVMDSIRPDDDELRADAPIGSSERKRPAPKKAAAAPAARSGGSGGSGKRPVGNGNGNGGNGKGGLAAVWLLLIAVAVAAVAGWYSQNQRIQALESQLEEADYWARQSKLALARFEGELSETGENLQERGQSREEQITSNKST